MTCYARDDVMRFGPTLTHKGIRLGTKVIGLRRLRPHCPVESHPAKAGSKTPRAHGMAGVLENKQRANYQRAVLFGLPYWE